MRLYIVRLSNTEVLVEVTSYTPMLPARIYGPVENCYPEEPEEIEFEISDEEKDVEFLQEMLERCEWFSNEIEKQLLEQIHESD